MIELIIGRRGSGKTKRLISLVNEAVEKSDGNVVCVEKGHNLTYSISHKARLVDTDYFEISGFDAFYGLLSGICAGNFDVTDIFVDATLRIGGRDFNQLAEFFKKVSSLSDKCNTKFTFTVSCEESDLPSEIFEVAKII
ncbi:MAG TPA: hypothetical protein GXX17_05085 [Clostridiales bacterium]|nr:hypothetical protein [Clostridiales bacterium]